MEAQITSGLEGRGDDLDLLNQVSSLRGLLALSMLMTERNQPEEIIHLAATAVPALVAATCHGAHVTFGDSSRWHSLSGQLEQPMARADVLAQLRQLPGDGGALTLAPASWAWAFGLPSSGGHVGHFIIAADRQPSEDDLLLLRSLSQQTGIALANARLHTSHRTANTMLTETITSLRNKTAIHNRFTKVALERGGQQGVVDALFELTGLSAVVEDRTGKVLVSASTPGSAVRRATFSQKRDDIIALATRSGHPVRVEDRILTVVQPHPNVLGVLMLVDPSGVAGEIEMVALEHGATVLSIELARLHGLAETELRLGRNLVSELLAGSGAEVFERALALGHDLSRPHRVLTVRCEGKTGVAEDTLLRIRETLSGSIAAGGSDPTPLLMQSGRDLVAIVSLKSTEDGSLSALLRAAGRAASIGVGGICRKPEDYPRSHREASVALRVARLPRTRSPILRYEELGIYQLLAESTEPTTLQSFVSRWAGRLIEYDQQHSSDLLGTLAAFLDVGGNYDATAQALQIGRSTVRYRISRIHEISGHDLADPEVRFQLQLAVRAWGTLQVLMS